MGRTRPGRILEQTDVKAEKTEGGLSTLRNFRRTMMHCYTAYLLTAAISLGLYTADSISEVLCHWIKTLIELHRRSESIMSLVNNLDDDLRLSAGSVARLTPPRFLAESRKKRLLTSSYAMSYYVVRLFGFIQRLVLVRVERLYAACRTWIWIWKVIGKLPKGISRRRK